MLKNAIEFRYYQFAYCVVFVVVAVLSFRIASIRYYLLAKRLLNTASCFLHDDPRLNPIAK